MIWVWIMSSVRQGTDLVNCWSVEQIGPDLYKYVYARKALKIHAKSTVQQKKVPE